MEVRIEHQPRGRKTVVDPERAPPCRPASSARSRLFSPSSAAARSSAMRGASIRAIRGGQLGVSMIEGHEHGALREVAL